MASGRHRRTDAGALAHLRRADAVLARVIDAHPDFDPRDWLTDLPAMDAFGALVFQVVGQQLSVAATRRILDRLCEPFDGHLPTPRQLLDADPGFLRSAGLSARKVATLRATAELFDRGDLSDTVLRTMSDEEIERRLTAVPGIGPWTVHGMLIIALDRPDVVLPGDLALRRAIQQVYGLDAPPTPEQVLTMADRWRPHRSLATAYLFAAELGQGGVA